MATYVTLGNFTEQGLRNVKESPKRAEAFRNLAKQLGCNVKEVLWTQGQYDFVTTFEAQDDATASALILSIGKLGNVTGQTLRAYNAVEIKNVLEKVV